MVAITTEMTVAPSPLAALLAGPLEAPLDVAGEVGWVGLAAAAVLAVAALALRRVRRPLPAAGLAMAAAGLVAVAIADTDEAGGTLHVLGIAAAAAGAWAGRLLRLPLLVRPVLVVPGVAVTVEAMHLADRSTVVWPTVLVAAVLAVLVADADESLAQSAAGPPLLAVSIFGMYVTIPETGQILPVLVVAVPIALVGRPALPGPVGRGGVRRGDGAAGGRRRRGRPGPGGLDRGRPGQHGRPRPRTRGPPPRPRRTGLAGRLACAPDPGPRRTAGRDRARHRAGRRPAGRPRGRHRHRRCSSGCSAWRRWA